MIEELVTRMFEIRNKAHVRHWETNSYSEHQALGKYYDNVIDKLDEIVESYQGGFGLIKNLPYDVKDVKKDIEAEMLWLAKNREAIAQNVPAIENLIDDLSGLHMRTLYKLDNLR